MKQRDPQPNKYITSSGNRSPELPNLVEVLGDEAYGRIGDAFNTWAKDSIAQADCMNEDAFVGAVRQLYGEGLPLRSESEDKLRRLARAAFLRWDDEGKQFVDRDMFDNLLAYLLLPNRVLRTTKDLWWDTAIDEQIVAKMAEQEPGLLRDILALTNGSRPWQGNYGLTVGEILEQCTPSKKLHISLVTHLARRNILKNFAYDGNIDDCNRPVIRSLTNSEEYPADQALPRAALRTSVADGEAICASKQDEIPEYAKIAKAVYQTDMDNFEPLQPWDEPVKPPFAREETMLKAFCREFPKSELQGTKRIYIMGLVRGCRVFVDDGWRQDVFFLERDRAELLKAP